MKNQSLQMKLTNKSSEICILERNYKMTCYKLIERKEMF